MAGVNGLDGALAVVTGAAKGIGRATALKLAEQGARVVALDLDGGGAEATAAACSDEGPGAWGRQCDVADADGFETVAKQVVADHGVPNVLVNNAGVGVSGAFLDTPVETWDWIVGVNLMGVVHGCRFFGEAMVERGSGQVVNLSSGLGYIATPDEPAYCATKAAVLSLSRSLRADWAPKGVGVTAVCPGIVDTGITDRTRFHGDDADEARSTATELFHKRNYPPEKVATAIVRSLPKNPAVVTPGPEAWAARVVGRLAPDLTARLARRGAERRRRRER